MGVRSGVRPGADPAGWGAPVPAPQQPETPVHQPEGDQPETTDVTGKGCTKARSCVFTVRIDVKLNNNRVKRFFKETLGVMYMKKVMLLLYIYLDIKYFVTES